MLKTRKGLRQNSHLLLTNKHFTKRKDLISHDVARHAAQPRRLDSILAAVDTVKCMTLYVTAAAKKLKYPLSHVAISQYTAMTVTVR